MDQVPSCIGIVRSLLLRGKSYSEISDELQQLNPQITRGLSTRSVRRFVKSNDLRELYKQDMKCVIDESVREVSL